MTGIIYRIVGIYLQDGREKAPNISSDESCVKHKLKLYHYAARAIP